MKVFTSIVIVASGLFIFNAQAEEKTFSFVPPTECENGDAIGSSDVCPELDEYRLQCSNSQGSPYEFAFFYPIPETNQISRDFAVGDYWCVLSVRHSASEDFSKWSNEVNFSIAAQPTVPNPPVLSVD